VFDFYSEEFMRFYVFPIVLLMSVACFGAEEKFKLEIHNRSSYAFTVQVMETFYHGDIDRGECGHELSIGLPVTLEEKYTSVCGHWFTPSKATDGFSLSISAINKNSNRITDSIFIDIATWNTIKHFKVVDCEKRIGIKVIEM
jgi:hypothetical protein